MIEDAELLRRYTEEPREGVRPVECGNEEIDLIEAQNRTARCRSDFRHPMFVTYYVTNSGSGVVHGGNEIRFPRHARLAVPFKSRQFSRVNGLPETPVSDAPHIRVAS
jgi:hypothetical protein